MLRLGFRTVISNKYFGENPWHCSLTTTHCRWFKKRTKTDESKYEILRKKIIYNSVLNTIEGGDLTYFSKRRVKYKQLKEEFRNSDEYVPEQSICLKYVDDGVCNKKDESDTPPNLLTSSHMPFGQQQKITMDRDSASDTIIDTSNELKWLSSSEKILSRFVSKKHWLPHDPSALDDTVKVDGENLNIKYGTSDPEIPISDVPCGGCGALLHCQEPSIPGFMPKEIFEGLTKQELLTLECQRCHFLKEYNIALGVDVSPEDYPKMLGQLSNRKSLVLLMVDLLDMPCSIWPGIVDLIGRKKPIVVVANKVDLIMRDSRQFFRNVEESLIDCLISAGIPEYNVKHIALISAKTGFGIESLITEIHSSWSYQGDIYIVGCTNVGKSTLFNALIQSDLCKSQAVDVMQKATVSEWPGTTLNLLKFPMLRPSTWRIQIRKERLLSLASMQIDEEEAELARLKKDHYRKQSSLKGDVGRSFVPESPMASMTDPFSLAISRKTRGASPLGLNPDNPIYADGKWCYDTPGVVHPDQALNILTTPEIMATLPKKLIIPRPIHLRLGHTIFVAGLARLDFLKGPDYAWFTVFAADTLPITVTKTEDADSVYDELLGTELLNVPLGDSSRLAKWPMLSGKTIQISGKIRNEVAADVVMSSAGWIAVTLEPAEYCELQAWTPGGRGIHIRLPLVKKAQRFRASKIKDTPVFRSRIEMLS